MAIVTDAFEMGTVIGIKTTGTVGTVTTHTLGAVTGETDPAVTETANGITYHRLGSVYTEEYEQVDI